MILNVKSDHKFVLKSIANTELYSSNAKEFNNILKDSIDELIKIKLRNISQKENDIFDKTGLISTSITQIENDLKEHLETEKTDYLKRYYENAQNTAVPLKFLKNL